MTGADAPTGASGALILTGERILLGALIDYAGLFPPASLGMEEAVEEYRTARRGPTSWLLGRFVSPATGLQDLGRVLTRTMRVGEPPWSLSVILDGDAGRAAAAAQAFAAEMDSAATIDVVEAPMPPAVSDGRPVADAVGELEAVFAAAISVDPGVFPFFEVAMVGDWVAGVSNAMAAVAETSSTTRRPAGVKLRCGGLSADSFPSPAQVVHFMVEASRLQLRCKATAGLHHPVRHHDERLDVIRHGFVNLLAVSAFLLAGADHATLLEVVEETDPAAFRLGPGGLTWRDLGVPAGVLRAARNDLFVSYGSCSFVDPVADMANLGWLGAGAPP